MLRCMLLGVTPASCTAEAAAFARLTAAQLHVPSRKAAPTPRLSRFAQRHTPLVYRSSQHSARRA